MASGNAWYPGNVGRVAAAAAVLFCVGAQAADNQCCPGPDCPEGMVIVSAFGAGSPADLVTRSFALGLGNRVTVENRPGAGGTPAAVEALRSGRILAASETIAINTSLYAKLPYQLEKDFRPLTQIASSPFVLVVHPSLPVRNVKELITFGKKRADLDYGSEGPGSASHLVAEQFKLMTGTRYVHVPYKGGGPLYQALMRGEISIAFLRPAAARPSIAAGKLRALAVTSAKRSALLPDIPTVQESGVPGFEAQAWIGLFDSGKKPDECEKKSRPALQRALGSPEVRKGIENAGFEVASSTPEQFASFVRSEIGKWAKVVKASGAKVE